jgi:hypothetical protein
MDEAKREIETRTQKWWSRTLTGDYKNETNQDYARAKEIIRRYELGFLISAIETSEGIAKDFYEKRLLDLQGPRLGLRVRRMLKHALLALKVFRPSILKASVASLIFIYGLEYTPREPSTDVGDCQQYLRSMRHLGNFYKDHL